MIETERLWAWYSQDHLPMREIEARTGLTRQGIWKRLRRAHLLTPSTIRRAPVQTVTCAECQELCLAARWRINKQRHIFCGTACYRQWLTNPDYQPSRQGQRRARTVVREFFPLHDTHIVHHIDGHQEHNDPCNLMVFATNADHMAWHHSSPSVQPLWRGDQLETQAGTEGRHTA